MPRDILDILRDANYHRNTMLDPEGKFDLLFFSNELGGEAGEAQNKVKKIVRERMGFTQFSKATVAELAEELADVIICCDLIAMKEDIDLRTEIVKKFNKTSQSIGSPIYMTTKV